MPHSVQIPIQNESLLLVYWILSGEKERKQMPRPPQDMKALFPRVVL